MKRLLLLTAGFGLATLAAPAHAQASDYETALRGQTMEARVGLIIPFGGDGKSKKSKPQLALMSRRTGANKASVDWAKKPEFERKDYTETRLTLTLSAAPELRLNDRAVYHFETNQTDVSDDVKTAGKVALGAGLVVLAAGVVVVGVYAISIATADGPLDGE